MDSVKSPVANSKIIFILGGPGVGKGTQGAKLAEELPLVHLSVGDLVRAEQQYCTPETREAIERCVQKGTVVPLNVVIGVLQSAISRHVKEGRRNFLVDNFPRDMEQTRAFEEQVTFAPSPFSNRSVKALLDVIGANLFFEEKIGPCNAALYFMCDKETMLRRLRVRAKTSGRADDTENIFLKRVEDFHRQIGPVLEYLERTNNVVKVNCDKSIDELYPSIKKIVEVPGYQLATAQH